ncbi:MAG: isoprenyl transferase [Planctomycetes bacterium SM23_25]|nr:MAG: isoprenyl transferase [Planctomycetes bacterium DG_20]KPK49151.1 MAG: isoprenyl transferase [Planctomycetes bacterium SM23_25]
MAEADYMPDVLADVPREAWPGHIAIIMDGNGRWAKARGLPRIEGHREGAANVRRITEEASRLGLEQLTLFAFSSENWRRPPEEVAFLMELYRTHVVQERPTMMKNHIRFRTIGRREGIPDHVLEEVDRTIEMTAANTGTTLCLAVNYGSRREIVDAARTLAERAARGQLDPSAISEETFDAALDTAGMPDPDLLIRTADEMRLSNFLLWQMSYAELWVTGTRWPDFREAELHEAIRDFAGRERRFGGLPPQDEAP